MSTQYSSQVALQVKNRAESKAQVAQRSHV